MTERFVALVTGAAYGIGAGIVRRLAADGFTVAATAEVGLSDQPAPPDGRSHALEVVADLTDPVAAAGVVEKVVRSLGRLDVLVNNAGITRTAALADADPADLDRLVAVNLKAPWHAIRAAVPALRRAGGGAIVNVTSLHADRGMPGFSIYAATKGGVSALTRQLAIELAPEGIRVNAVQPGMIDAARLHKDGWYGSGGASERIPLGRVGTPDDIAAAVSFLAGPDAAYVTGVVLPVDGGVRARLALADGD